MIVPFVLLISVYCVLSANLSEFTLILVPLRSVGLPSVKVNAVSLPEKPSGTLKFSLPAPDIFLAVILPGTSGLLLSLPTFIVSSLLALISPISSPLTRFIVALGTLFVSISSPPKFCGAFGSSPTSIVGSPAGPLYLPTSPLSNAPVIVRSVFFLPWITMDFPSSSFIRPFKFIE